MNTILTAYFSRRGNNYYGGIVKYLEVGNTEIVARRIHERVGGALLHIETVQPYAEDYRQCIEEAKRELRANVRPQLVTTYRGTENIDLLLLGYPNWCGTMPMAVWTFLESRDFTGTRIAPFCTHEGGGMGVAGVTSLHCVRTARYCLVLPCGAARSIRRMDILPPGWLRLRYPQDDTDAQANCTWEATAGLMPSARPMVLHIFSRTAWREDAGRQPKQYKMNAAPPSLSIGLGTQHVQHSEHTRSFHSSSGAACDSLYG